MAYGVRRKFADDLQYGMGRVVRKLPPRDGESYSDLGISCVRPERHPQRLFEVLHVEDAVPQVPEAVAKLAPRGAQRGFRVREAAERPFEVSAGN